MNTRIAKVFTKMVEEFDITDIDLNFEKPEEVIEIFKNPEHPIMQKLIQKVQNLIKEKVQRGEISQSQLMTEIEAIKAKITGLFGNIFKDAMGLGGGNSVSGSVMMGTSPEARRQRMLARLQKKQRDKNSR